MPTYHGTSRADQLNYSAATNWVDVYAGGGDDWVMGGAFDDRLWGGDGNDQLYGLGGPDDLSGEAGNDFLAGGDGNDAIWGGIGDDKLYGGDDNDYLSGGADNDRLWGDVGDDKLYGDSGDDRLDGGLGNDELYGGRDRDTLWGGRGDDVLDGGAGIDRLLGGQGADRLTGGLHQDTFVFTAGDIVMRTTGSGSYVRTYEAFETDTITDFDLNIFGGDVIDVSDLLDHKTSFTGTTAQQALAQGYIYAVSHGTAGQADFGATLYIDRDGGRHHSAPGVYGDFAIADLQGVDATQLNSWHFLV